MSCQGQEEGSNSIGFDGLGDGSAGPRRCGSQDGSLHCSSGILLCTLHHGFKARLSQKWPNTAEGSINEEMSVSQDIRTFKEAFVRLRQLCARGDLLSLPAGCHTVGQTGAAVWQHVRGTVGAEYGLWTQKHNLTQPRSESCMPQSQLWLHWRGASETKACSARKPKPHRTGALNPKLQCALLA